MKDVNITNNYPEILNDESFNKVVSLIEDINKLENELSEINTKKIELELNLEKLKTKFNDFRGLVTVEKIHQRKSHVEEVKTSKIFGIISEGEGNTRIG